MLYVPPPLHLFFSSVLLFLLIPYIISILSSFAPFLLGIPSIKLLILKIKTITHYVRPMLHLHPSLLIISTSPSTHISRTPRHHSSPFTGHSLTLSPSRLTQPPNTDLPISSNNMARASRLPELRKPLPGQVLWGFSAPKDRLSR